MGVLRFLGLVKLPPFDSRKSTRLRRGVGFDYLNGPAADQGLGVGKPRHRKAHHNPTLSKGTNLSVNENSMTRPVYLTRALFAIIVALLVFATTCYASWVALWSVPVSNRFMWAHGILLYIEEALEKYKATKGEYPDSLEELSSVSENMRLDDPWQRDFHYASKGQTYQLCSLGRDGQPGGVGFDTDIYVDTSLSDMQLPLSQFFFQARGSRASLLVACLAALCAGATSYLSITRQPDQDVFTATTFRATRRPRSIGSCRRFLPFSVLCRC